jgi:hypothetical protein
MNVADTNVQARVCARQGSSRSVVPGFKLNWANVCLRVCSSDGSCDSNADADGAQLDHLVRFNGLKFQRFRQSAVGSSMV